MSYPQILRGTLQTAAFHRRTERCLVTQALVPGALPGTSYGIEIFFDQRQLRDAALMLAAEERRRLGPLRVQPATDALREFVLRDFLPRWMRALFPFHVHSGSIWDAVGQVDANTEAECLARFISRQFDASIFLCPSVDVTVASACSADGLFVVPARDLAPTLQAMAARDPGAIEGAWFPPSANFEWGKPLPAEAAWIGCRALHKDDGEAKLKRILGAMTVAAYRGRIPLLSGATPPGRYAVMRADGGWSATTGDPIPPPFLERRRIEGEQIHALQLLLHALDDMHDWGRRLSIALEFVAEALTASENLKFIFNAIALDALFAGGTDEGTTKAIELGVAQNAGGIANAAEKMRLLTPLRGALVHGNVAGLPVSSKYLKFWRKYGEDPLQAQTKIIHEAILGMATGHAQAISP